MLTLIFLSKLPASEAKLVAGADGQTILEINFKHFFAVDFAASLVAQGSHNFLGFRIDDFTGRRKSKMAVDAKSSPAGLFPKHDAGGLARGHDGGVKYVEAAVGGITNPDFFLIRREAH